MALLEILKPPAPVLRKVAEEVDAMDDKTQKLLDDMLETMYDAPGIGLAAPQIGISKRIVVMDTAKEDEPRQPLFIINPKITKSSEEMNIYQEGCLSLPEIYDDVERPACVDITFRDRNWNEISLSCDGLLATCIQHEIDHLNGVLFIDYLSRLKRDRILKKFVKQHRLSNKSLQS